MRTDAMLTLDQKAHILRRAGIAVPARPEAQMTAGHQERAASPTPDPGRGWEMQVEARYAQYVLARATRSLRQAEMSLQMGAAPHTSQRTQNS